MHSQRVKRFTLADRLEHVQKQNSTKRYVFPLGHKELGMTEGLNTHTHTHLVQTVVTPKQYSSVQSFQSCPTLCNPMNHSRPGLPVHHQLLEFTQIQVHRVSDAIQPSHPLSSPSPPAPNPSQHQSFPMSQLFSSGGQSTGVSALASFLPKKSQG